MYSESYRLNHFPDSVSQEHANSKRSVRKCLCYCCVCFIIICLVLLLTAYLIFNLVIDDIIEQKVFDAFKMEQDKDAANVRKRVLDREKELVSKDVGVPGYPPMSQTMHVIQTETKGDDQIFMQCYWSKTNESSGLVLVSIPVRASIPKLGDQTLTKLALHGFGRNTCFYDYPGNGYSSGKPSESKLYETLNRVFIKLTEKTNKDGMNIDKEKIILFGHSIGATLSVNLASNQRGLGGLILVTPFTSLFAIAKNMNLMPSQLKPFLSLDGALMRNRDKFRSDDKIGKISDVPVLVLRGKQDKNIPCEHAEKLVKKLKEEGKNDKVTLTQIDARLDETFDEKTLNLLIPGVQKFLHDSGLHS